MKKILAVTAMICLVNASASYAQLVTTETLEQFFVDNNVEYFTVPDFHGSGGELDYVFIPTRDPQDNETIGIFFELQTGNALNDPLMHWAIGLRGPRAGLPSDHYGGRGLALGHLSDFDFCSGVGGFIEDFTAGKLGGDNDLTTCVDEPIQNYSTYRIDIHVSLNNVYVQIWKKTYLPWVGFVYQKIANYGCNRADCREDSLTDGNYGSVFLGSAVLAPGHNWTASNIHVAFF